MKTSTIIIICVVVVIVLLLFWLIKTYNKLVSLRNRVKDQWAQIDVQLKRRFDLIPNLVETVKGYATHESDTLEAIVNARNKYVGAASKEDQMASDVELTQAVSKLFALAEAYPDLKANTNFQELQTEISETESKIASARQFYNDTVLMYTNKLEAFPSNIIAKLFKFKKEAFFQAQDEERKNVQVKF